MKPIIKNVAFVLLALAAVLSIWAVSKCVGATSITITDTCASYVVNNSNGVATISCSTNPPPAPPPPPPPGDVTCPGFAETINMAFTYIPGTGQIVKTSDGMTPSDILVAYFTTPATINGGTGSGGSLQITDNAQNSAGFVASFATTPCTFTTNVKSGLLSASWNFASVPLKPNTRYFLNIKGDSALSVKLLAR